YKQIRLATHGTLPEDHQRAGQDIGTFHGDRHRDALVREGQEVARAELDGSTGHDVHAVVDHAAHDLGCMVFGHGGHHRRRTAFQPFGHQVAHGFQGIGTAGDVGSSFLNAFEFTDFHVELATNARECAHHAIAHLTAGCSQCGQ